jgi:hemerythrin-like metal-binding protein
MPFAEWSDGFSIGIEEIDQEHKKLLNLVNVLHDTVEAGGAHEALGEVLDELMRYVIYHFSHEEELFLRTNYPGAERHLKQHSDLTGATKKVYDEFRLNASETLPLQVLEFLKNWLYEHILGSDRAFGVYYNSWLAKHATGTGHARAHAAQ